MTELVALLDGEGSFATLREVCGVDDDTTWQVPFYAFLARVGGATVLVDTGLGPSGVDPFLPAWQGRLPEALADAGVAPGQVDLVVLTHLHVDHVGWTMRDGAPFFPNARYVAHRDDYQWITSVDGDQPYVRDNVVALNATGRLELVEDGAVPLAGVAVLCTGGHTPGHCIVELGDATLLGDLVVHELQLADPALAFASEEDPSAIAKWRRRLLPDLASSGRLVGFGHLGLGRVVRERAGFAWRPSDGLPRA